MTAFVHFWKFNRDELTSRIDDLCKNAADLAEKASAYWVQQFSSSDISSQRTAEAAIFGQQSLLDGMFGDVVDFLPKSQEELTTLMSTFADAVTGATFTEAGRPADLQRVRQAPQAASELIVALRRAHRNTMPLNKTIRDFRKSGALVRGVFLFSTMIALLSGLTWWFIDRGGIFQTERRTYRFEVTVETPEGLKTAYSVHEITIQDMTWTPARNYQIDLVGEAVPFVLKDGRTLFATLALRNGAIFEQALGPAVMDGNWIAIREDFDFHLKEMVLPRLALIDAPDKPETLRMLDGRKPFATTERSIGKEALAYLERERAPDPMESLFRVVDARLATTDERITTKVADLLPWIRGMLDNRPIPAEKIGYINITSAALKTGVVAAEVP